MSSILLCFCLIEISSDSFYIFLILEIHIDRSRLHLAYLEDTIRDFFCREWTFRLLEDIEDDIEDSSIFVSPVFQDIDTTTDKDEFLISDEFIMDRRYLYWLREVLSDRVRDIEKVHRLLLLFEDIDSLVFKSRRIEYLPLLETDEFLFSFYEIDIDIDN